MYQIYYISRRREKYTDRHTKLSRCEYNVSIRKNTFFSNSHMSIAKIILLTYLWIKQTNQTFIRKELSISKHTMVDWAIFCREVTFDIYLKKKLKSEVTLLKSKLMRVNLVNTTEAIMWKASGYLEALSGVLIDAF